MSPTANIVKILCPQKFPILRYINEQLNHLKHNRLQSEFDYKYMKVIEDYTSERERHTNHGHQLFSLVTKGRI